VLLQHPDDLIFREPCSLHLSVLQEGRTLNPRGGKSQWQVNTLVFLRTRRAFPSARQATGEGQRSRGLPFAIVGQQSPEAFLSAIFFHRGRRAIFERGDTRSAEGLRRNALDRPLATLASCQYASTPHEVEECPLPGSPMFEKPKLSS
jgi:hypothetical protein